MCGIKGHSSFEESVTDRHGIPVDLDAAVEKVQCDIV